MPGRRGRKRRTVFPSQESEAPSATQTSKSEDDDDEISPPKRHKPAPVKIKVGGLSQSSTDSSKRPERKQVAKAGLRKTEEFDFEYGSRRQPAKNTTKAKSARKKSEEFDFDEDSSPEKENTKTKNLNRRSAGKKATKGKGTVLPSKKASVVQISQKPTRRSARA